MVKNAKKTCLHSANALRINSTGIIMVSFSWKLSELLIGYHVARTVYVTMLHAIDRLVQSTNRAAE